MRTSPIRFPAKPNSRGVETQTAAMLTCVHSSGSPRQCSASVSPTWSPSAENLNNFIPMTAFEW
jgi:hypothetical protein